MKAKTMLVLAFCAVGALGRSAPAADMPLIDPEEREKVAETIRLKAEISLLNLLNGLYLSPDQLDKLIELADRAVEMHRGYATGLATEPEAYVRQLDALREALYTATGPSEDVKRRAVELEVKVDLGPKRRMADELGRLEDEARRVLNDGQVAIIEGFQPCLIPPRTLADPVAVGQASTTEREEITLDVIRRMPQSLYAQRRETIADTIVRRGEREKGQVPEDVRQGMVKTYLGKMDELRGLDEVDFDLKKKDLAEDFQLFDDDVTYRKGHTRELGQISRYLLNSSALDVMKRWREARVHDEAETELSDVGDSAHADWKTKLYARLLAGYERMALALVRERMRIGKLDRTDGHNAQEALADARRIPDLEKRFAAIDSIIGKLNAIAVTKASVDAMSLKVACLSYQKRVPGVVQPRRGRARPFDDVTGLGEMVQQADQDAARGRITQAYSTLARVAEYLKQFKD